jgi:hypothetical protein
VSGRDPLGPSPCVCVVDELMPNQLDNEKADAMFQTRDSK